MTRGAFVVLLSLCFSLVPLRAQQSPSGLTSSEADYVGPRLPFQIRRDSAANSGCTTRRWASRSATPRGQVDQCGSDPARHRRHRTAVSARRNSPTCCSAPGNCSIPARYFIILPDGIGHGKSSQAERRAARQLSALRLRRHGRRAVRAADQGLGVDHLRLVMGTSMGCMHSLVWGETYPDFMDALMPLACLPVQIAGRNRMWREMVMQAIRRIRIGRTGIHQPRERFRSPQTSC